MFLMRCQHYFDDGQPIKDGCHYKHNCRFVHPHHYEWDTVVPATHQRARIYGQRDYTRGPKADFVVEKTASYDPHHGRGPSRSPTPPPRPRVRAGAGHRRDDSYASKASVERRRDHDMDHGDPGSSASGSRSEAKVMDVDASPTTRRDYERPRTPQRDRERDRDRERERERGRDRSPGQWTNPFSPTRADLPPTTPGTTTTTMGRTTSPRSPRLPPTAPRWLRSQHPQDPPPPPPSSAPPLSLNMAANAASSSSSVMPAPPATAPLHRPPPLLNPLSAHPLPPPPNSAPMQSSRSGPSQTKPLGPLPVVPDLPSILQLNQDTPGPSTEDASKREKLWDERIKLLADSVLVYESIQKLQDEHETAQKILNSTLFATLDPSARERLVAQNTELQTRLDAERTAFRRQNDALVNQTFWPTAPLRRVGRDEEQQYMEMKGFVRDLNGEVMSMKALLSEIEEIKRAGVRKDKGKGKERAQEDEDETMFVDEDGDGDVSMSETALPQASGISSRKRRRLSSGEAAPSAAARAPDTRVTDPASPDYIPTAAELEALRDVLLKCSHDISDMQNEVTRANHDWADTVRTAVEGEMEAERARRREGVEEREREAQEERTRQKEEVRRRVEEVKGQVGDLGGQVVEVTESLAGLVLQAGKLEEEVEEARTRRERAFERLAEVEIKMKSYTDAQARNAEAISTLRTAIEAYLTQPPSPPVSPAPTATAPALAGPDAAAASTAALPPVEYMLQSLEPALTTVARATMRPLLEQLRKEMNEVIKQNNAEMYTAFHEKMGKARQVVHAISQHLPQLALQPGAGAAQAGPSGVRAGGSAGPQGKAPSGTSTRMA